MLLMLRQVRGNSREAHHLQDVGCSILSLSDANAKAKMFRHGSESYIYTPSVRLGPLRILSDPYNASCDIVTGWRPMLEIYCEGN